MTRILNIKGRYVGFPGILTFQGFSTTIFVEEDSVDLTEAENKAAREIAQDLQAETDQKAAEAATKNFFFRRTGELISWELSEDQTLVNGTLASTEGLETLLEDETTDTGD